MVQKIIDAIPEIKKVDKKKKAETFTDKLNKIVDEDLEDISNNPQALFEQDYNLLAEEMKKKRNRGINDAKAHLAKMFPEKIKALGKKYGVDVTEQLNYTWQPNKRNKQEFDFDKQ